MRTISEPKLNSAMPDSEVSSKVVAIASSTGGPRALQEVLPAIPADIDAPILIVQHMPDGFTKTLADRLNSLCQISVLEAEDGMIMKKGCAYIAKAGKHMQIGKRGRQNMICLTDEPPREGVKPCADYMYESLAYSNFKEIVNVVLTGMGADGTAGITALNKKKKTKVIVQDEATCVVYGMPGSIVKHRIKCKQLPLKDIANEIIKETGVIQNGC